MEQIIKFLEQYWGQSLIGTVTLGTVFTFIVTQIKAGIRDKAKNKTIDSVVDQNNNLRDELKVRDAQRSQEINSLTKQLAEARKTIFEQQNKLVEKEAYFEKVQAVTFQAISYLVVASKLPTEDKIALQEKFTTLVKDKTVEYTNVIKDEVLAIKGEVKEVIIPDAVETVTNVVEETKSLLDKYTKKEG